jgi:hypothetical protein
MQQFLSRDNALAAALRVSSLRDEENRRRRNQRVIMQTIMQIAVFTGRNMTALADEIKPDSGGRVSARR